MLETSESLNFYVNGVYMRKFYFEFNDATKKVFRYECLQKWYSCKENTINIDRTFAWIIYLLKMTKVIEKNHLRGKMNNIRIMSFVLKRKWWAAIPRLPNSQTEKHNVIVCCSSV